jgi:endonuclease G
MAEINSSEIARAERILDVVREEWLERPGVVAVDLGYKWVAGQMTPELSIRVHVVSKKRRSFIPKHEIFPEELGGIKVDVIEANYIPQAYYKSKLESAVDGRDDRYQVVPLGVSIGSRFSTAGTLGAKVIDLKSGDEMILSNWHVMAGRPGARAGTPIWQPGWIDGGTNEDNTIAQLTRWVLGPHDAAVATITGARKVTTKTLEGRSIVDVTEPRLGMRVWKSGRSTGYTEGLIDGIKMRVSLPYGDLGVKKLESVFHIVPRPGAGDVEISRGGDSGAVWVDQASGKAVGLHFAGESANLPEHALAGEIILITEALNVRFPNQSTRKVTLRTTPRRTVTRPTVTRPTVTRPRVNLPTIPIRIDSQKIVNALATLFRRLFPSP